MVTVEDVGRTVTILAADDFYSFIDGWSGILAGIDNGFGTVCVSDLSVNGGIKVFLVPPEQLFLEVQK